MPQKPDCLEPLWTFAARLDSRLEQIISAVIFAAGFIRCGRRFRCTLLGAGCWVLGCSGARVLGCSGARVLGCSGVFGAGCRVPAFGQKKCPTPFDRSRAFTWRRPTLTRPIVSLPLALRRFTSGFGMGPGGSTALWSPEGSTGLRCWDSGDLSWGL